MIDIKISYLNRMKKSFIDKSWFMSIIPSDIDTIIDFGCADNSFNEYLRSSFPEYTYVGIENNPAFLEKIHEKGDICFSSLKELANDKTISLNPDSTLLVLNSVIHEIYSYYDIDAFWQEVKLVDPKYIAFRDMYAKNCGIYGSRIEQEFERSIKMNFMEYHYKDFVNYWGKLKDGYTATHFLLKYFYDDNWKQEVKENYLPYHYRELHTKIRNAGYNITFERFYGLPFLKDKWNKDFNTNEYPHLKTFIDRLTTHLKLFLVRGAEY